MCTLTKVHILSDRFQWQLRRRFDLRLRDFLRTERLDQIPELALVTLLLLRDIVSLPRWFLNVGVDREFLELVLLSLVRLVERLTAHEGCVDACRFVRCADKVNTRAAASTVRPNLGRRARRQRAQSAFHRGLGCLFLVC